MCGQARGAAHPRALERGCRGMVACSPGHHHRHRRVDFVWQRLAWSSDRVPTRLSNLGSVDFLSACSLPVGALLASGIFVLSHCPYDGLVDQSCCEKGGHFGLLGTTSCRRSSRRNRGKLHRTRRREDTGDLGPSELQEGGRLRQMGPCEKGVFLSSPIPGEGTRR